MIQQQIWRRCSKYLGAWFDAGNGRRVEHRSKDVFLKAPTRSIQRPMRTLTGRSTVECMISEILRFTYVGIRDYFIYFGVSFVMLWFLLRPKIERRKVQLKQRANAKQWLHEVKWSLISQVGFIVGLLVFGDGRSPGLLLQMNTGNLGILVASSIAFILIDDAWFYWTHQLLHSSSRLYRSVHKIHHRSIDTTPLTGLSFHPLESFVIAIPLGVLPLFIGVQPNFLIVALLISTFNNILGHNGFEWAPRWWDRIPVLRLKTPSIHHNLHHEKSRGNYGLYFIFWDRWMGTEFADYESRKVALRTRMDARSTIRPSEITNA
jgi:sterol desaturase/sphingolipid hydroxylase (fatty acid hydroxylase superfamily)